MRWPCALGCGRAYSELEDLEIHEARCTGEPRVTTRAVEAAHEGARAQAALRRIAGDQRDDSAPVRGGSMDPKAVLR